MAKKKPKTIEGTKLNYNASEQAKYEKALRKLVRQMTDEVKKEVVKFFEGGTAESFFDDEKKDAMDASVASQAKILTDKLTAKFQKLFAKKAPELAESMVDGSDKISRVNLGMSLKKLSGGLSIKTNFLTKDLNEVVKASVDENVALIKSIANEYLSKVKKSVMRSITTGNGLKDLLPAIEKYDGISSRQAKNIALDQTRKVYNSINKGRMEKLGIEKFKWLHSGGGQKPRKSHIAMNGNIYSWDDLPIINKDSPSEPPERGIPGQAINCRCTMTPVYEFTEDDDE